MDSKWNTSFIYLILIFFKAANRENTHLIISPEEPLNLSNINPIER